MRKLALIFSLGLGACLLQAQGQADTSGFVNGRWWVSISHQTKVGYLRGYMEARSSLDDLVKGNFSPKAFALRELEDFVDNFYSSVGNRAISVANTIVVFRCRRENITLLGMSCDELVNNLREAANYSEEKARDSKK